MGSEMCIRDRGYGRDDRFIRLELLMRDVTFDAMMRKLERLA